MALSARTAMRPLLLVDDSIDDVFIMSRQLQKAGFVNPIQIARDGEEAMQLLAKARPDSDFPVPAAIFTDLKMPRFDGLSLLTWMRQSSWLAKSLKVVVSTSDVPTDVRRAYDKDCDTYVTKYPSVEACAMLREAIAALNDDLPMPELPGLRRAYDGIWSQRSG